MARSSCDRSEYNARLLKRGNGADMLLANPVGSYYLKRKNVMEELARRLDKLAYVYSV